MGGLDLRVIRWLDKVLTVNYTASVSSTTPRPSPLLETRARCAGVCVVRLLGGAPPREHLTRVHQRARRGAYKHARGAHRGGPTEGAQRRRVRPPPLRPAEDRNGGAAAGAEPCSYTKITSFYVRGVERILAECTHNPGRRVPCP
eukprot:101018-Prorocentrum_minimum.AAC.1